jgi:signal transduction histidine kinase
MSALLGRRPSKAEIQEDFRRQALVWNSQYEAGRALIALIYRFRNAFRELSSIVDAKSGQERHQRRVLFNRLEAYGGGIIELLYEQRAILPQGLFRAAHDLRRPLDELKFFGRKVESNSEDPWHASGPEISERLAQIYKRIDTVYSTVVDLFQKNAGIETEG